MALRELLLVGAEHHGQVRVGRRLGLERGVDRELARRRRQQVLAADHVRDAHADVIERVGEEVGGRAIGAEDDVVALERVVPLDVTAHDVLDGGRPRGGHRQADRRGEAGRLAGRPLLGGETAASSRVDEREPGGLAPLALDLELLGGAVARVGGTALHQVCSRLRVELEPLRLPVRPLVPIDPEPAEDVFGLGNRLLGRPRPIGVLEPQDDPPARVARVEPVEEHRAHGPDVERARRAGRHADDGSGHGGPV